MGFEWQVNTHDSGSTTQCVYRFSRVSQLESDLEPLIMACVDKAVSLIPDNINDDACYLLFEFDENDVLNIVMTDDTKQRESAHGVCCELASARPYLSETSHWKFKDERFSDIIKYCIRDYLTTCGGFMRYSLVAVFSEGDRSKTQLL
ncbi:Uncharacterised protein [Zhongshania aliphaticivorans]|uniref:Uncharacterized protein n=1 Tax=Zhongshania aliphaticivorans TaxID=1470434 RepID=A0A5S9P735_9GAMM|nr:hypothetical protein [Zhongshania aliphaticivorans]CAA0092025.1 Uncharacterised protein [Zhongshania aliphaticivorans]CAA0099362.1 Uncharacterised protein [Zhongshania aliphaticivorans]